MADTKAIFHHIVLPPTLPFAQDEDTFAVGKALLKCLVQACHTLQDVAKLGPQATACNELITALGTWSNVYNEHVDKRVYHTALRSILSTDKQVLTFYIVEQNAALLVYCLDEDVVFEAFEASPQSQNVLATPNSLLWKFPSQAARMPKADLAKDENLQLALASFLSKATSEHLPHFAATGEKAGVSVSESRNPCSPALITHMLLSVIEALGSHASVHVLRKRVRDDVQFRSVLGGSGSGRGPWRRHPFWLILRVAVRRQLQLTFGTTAGHPAYKLLMSLVTANLLLDSVVKGMELTVVDLLRKKLCRRLAKLKKLPRIEGMQWRLDDPPVKALFQKTVNSANEYIQAEFNTFKRTHVRRVPKVPPRIDPNSDSLCLTLPNSLPYLRELSLRYTKQPGWLPTQNLACNMDESDLDNKLKDNPGVLHARDTYNEVSSLLYKVNTAMHTVSRIKQWYDNGEGEPERLCQTLSEILNGLMKSLPPLSSNDPEMNSQVCLTLFALWMDLDELTAEAFPMLLDYQPPFSPELLNVLQLSCLGDMKRVREIQGYLRRRCQTANFRRTIFGPLDQRCFGARYTQSSPPLMEFLSEIRETERERRETKKIEWEGICETYACLSTEIASLPCLCTIDENGERDVTGCEHCFKKRVLWRLSIKVCEDLLPEDDSLAAAIVFDLNIPAAFSAYRSTTWALIRQFAYPVRPASCGKTKKLADNRDLKDLYPTLPVFTCRTSMSICLASSKKAFMQTHYQEMRMWVELEELLVPHGSDYAMFDVETKTWVSNFDRPMTLAHLCRISIPSPLAQVFPKPAHPPTHPDGPSSYEAVANRPQCPGDLSPHEFEAYHYLLAGRARRWLTLLVELGSSNLNFGKDDTLLTCTHLAHEVGPEASSQDPIDSHGLVLGTCHAVFSDNSFVDRLLGEIQKRFDTIRSSWRETNSMDLVITLSLAIYVRATNTDQRRRAQDLVRYVRAAVLQWIDSLRKEGEKSAAASSSASLYSFRAALLGRRTFALFALKDTQDHEKAGCRSQMGSADVTEYLKLSIALQQNRVVDMGRLSRMDKIMLKRDVALAIELQDLILDVAVQYLKAVGEAVAYSIGIGKEAVTSFTLLKVHRGGRHCGWMTAEISTASGSQQVDLDCFEGHILVDGKTLRKLPDDIRDAEDVKELFGQKHLLTYPSNIPGAVCRLAAPVEGFLVHFGRHNEKPVIIAEGSNGSLSDFVPGRVFIDEASAKYDLPRGLVDDCVHWYDRNTGYVEISRKPDIWRSKEGNWRLHVATRQAWRRHGLLVDPYAPIFKTVANIFRGFEDPRRLTMYQPTEVHADGTTGTLKVELRHLDLTFSASRWGRLHCSELGAEIDPDQDAGTLYGYDSMIVMRERVEHGGRRSIIAPLGPLKWSCRGVHILLQTNIDDMPSRSGYRVSAEEKAYVRLAIDPVLGRLVCPPEPRLLYTKAQLHAFTSFLPLPDPLTGRTGEEEATATLLSGLCQPWEPLNDGNKKILQQIRRLCPERVFYPKDKRVLQQVSWDPFLPTGTQHDRYGRLVDRIMEQSEALKPFREGNQKQDGPAVTSIGNINDDGTACLHVRAEVQRLRFESPHSHAEIHTEAMQDSQNSDVKYKSLGQSARFKVAGVQEITKMLRNEDVYITEDLSMILEKWDRIGGQHEHRRNIGDISLAELMAVEGMNERWGSLVGLCARANSPQQTAEMIMALAVMAFSPGVDLGAVRWLAAFFSVPLLKDVRFPPYSVFSGFKFNEVPTQSYVESLIGQAYPPYAYTKTGLWHQDRGDMEKERKRHWTLCKQEGAKLARRMIMHWPDDLARLVTLTMSSNMIDVELALEKVDLQWQRLRSNWQLSRYAENADRIMQEQRSSNRLIQLDQQPNKKNWRTKVEDDGCLMGRTMAPSDIIPRLEDLARRDMEWSSAQASITSKPDRESATSTGEGTVPYKPTNEVLELGQLVSRFLRFSKRMTNELRIKYSSSLEDSLRALKRMHVQQLQQQGRTQEVEAPPSRYQAEQGIERAQETVGSFYQAICHSFKESGDGSWLQQAGLWPRLTPTTILELLRSIAPPASWGRQTRETLVQYGCALTKLQQFRRIQREMNKGNIRRAWEETRNDGHANWQPNDHADWLLLEIDSDILIRAQQVDVARALLAPESQANAVLQLNMGQGKTSCIVPMAMATLADGHQLARLIVPKALLLQTAQMVQSRLGGLIGREVRHLAFSRSLLSRHDIHDVLRTYEAHHNDLLHRRGILLVAPEHLLAFKLCGLQCLADCQRETTKQQQGRQGRQERTRLGLAQRMLALQERLANGLCRDVLDESDVILAVRTQLVYPSGAQTAVDGAPQRWKLAQLLLAIVEDQLPGLCHRFPQSISSVPRGAEEDGGHGFPIVQILQMDYIEEPLHSAIIEALSGGQATQFGAWAPGAAGMAAPEKQQILRSALGKESTATAIEAAAGLFSDSRAAQDNLLLVRGLLSHRILLVCLRKRWNVQYGLHPKRDPIAVPYEAKGVPSDRSEFGHPDVAILLTCLAFYYAGLTQDQFRDGLRHILCHHDDPVTAYANWTAGGLSSLPAELQQWNVINPDDENQAEKLWCRLRMTRPVVDHYLNTFVFPAHARQFSVKLQASAWDVPLGKKKKGRNGPKARTTGFSGTNDNRAMLPLTIQQLDIPHLLQTNAEVLTYLLQKRNREYHCCKNMVRPNGFGRTPPTEHRWSEDQLLRNLKDRGIRVLIDAGAYVLERDNKSLARAWLKIDHDAPAAVFFGEDDNRAWVLFRDTTAGCVPLVATPFVDDKRLGECLVYFDEAHTRGVDLLLPAGCRGGLTLALGQTKDHTVQAAMRLRQLGTTQSVIWYAPPEVDRSIRHVWRSVTGTQPPAYGLQSPHVLLWLLEQTCAANEQLHPLYLSQGYDFCRRSAAEKRYRQNVIPENDTEVYQDDINSNEEGYSDIEYDWRRETAESNGKARKQLIDTLQQPERLTINKLYGGSEKEGTKGESAAAPLSQPQRPAHSQSGQVTIFQRLLDQGYDHSRKMTTAAFEEVEQEREVEVQIEQVRELKTKVHFTALNFPGHLHWAIESFLSSGGTLPSRHGFHQVFASIARSEMGRRHEISIAGTTSALYVSVEFERTINPSGVKTREHTKGKDKNKNSDPSSQADDQFFRPVQWLLWSRLTDTAVVVVPEEAELLLLRLRRGMTTAEVHLLVYSAAVTRPMVDLSSGTYYSVPSLPPGYSLPSWLTIEAGILSGRLYMSFSESEAMRAYLESAASQGSEDGTRTLCPNLSSFLLDWLPLRRVGQDITHSPAAYICQGRPLQEDHAFFVR